MDFLHNIQDHVKIWDVRNLITIRFASYNAVHHSYEFNNHLYHCDLMVIPVCDYNAQLETSVMNLLQDSRFAFNLFKNKFVHYVVYCNKFDFHGE